MLDKIKDIKLALNNKSYLSALALSLTLPDICGQIEYPNLKKKNGRRNVGKQYAAWFDDWVNQYYADHTGWTKDYTKAKNPILTGRMCYSLRCKFLHNGNTDLDNWGTDEDEDYYYLYEFELFVNGADSSGEYWVHTPNINSKITKTKIVQININNLCKYICLAAEEYYHKKDSYLFKNHNIKLINLNKFL
ncbi:hypothetical protein [Thalassobacillus sp. B23F22_16]|uniref:hypothetical protein n=1 Tax=Thalassobacillus sp. B23F22_16 TaxID=3459513 RepID=UPI00373FACE6